MFLVNPCKHPIIVLKDCSSKLVNNLLEFMYLGSVNVKQIELQAFMKIAETLQIKGLTTNPHATLPKKLITETKSERSLSKSPDNKLTNNIKRPAEMSAEEYSQKAKEKRHHEATADIIAHNIDNSTNEEGFLPAPEISIIESKFEAMTKRDNNNESSALRLGSSQSLSNFGFDYSTEMSAPSSGDSKSFAEVPQVPAAGSNITMLSSTSLLHGNCIFNRNNTVATQQGLKTYWLCKSYRISMCKARCITHQGRVISATGVHNHLQHMNSKPTELPPGHSPNIFTPQSPPQETQFNNQSLPQLSTHPIQHSNNQSSGLMMHQPYHHYLHSHHQQMNQPQLQELNCQSHLNVTLVDNNTIPINSRLNLSQQSPSLQNSSPHTNSSPSKSNELQYDRSSNQTFKIEHI